MENKTEKERISLELQIRFYEKMIEIYKELSERAEQIEIIKKSLDKFSNVEYQLIECQRMINLLEIPLKTRIMFCESQLKKLYQCLKIREISKQKRFSKYDN